MILVIYVGGAVLVLCAVAALARRLLHGLGYLRAVESHSPEFSFSETSMAQAKAHEQRVSERWLRRMHEFHPIEPKR